MTKTLDMYDKIRNREWTRDRRAITLEEVRNSYVSRTSGEVIPANTEMVCDFAGDFGMYAVADINGVLTRVKIDLSDLHKIQFLQAPEESKKKLFNIFKGYFKPAKS